MAPTINDVDTAISIAERVAKAWRNRKSKRTEESLKIIKNSIIDLKTDNQKNNEELNQKLQNLDLKIDKNDMLHRRSRILQFSDEIRRGINHSQDSYINIMEDISKYELYCTQHNNPLTSDYFKNGVADSAVKNIKKAYDDHVQGKKKYLEEEEATRKVNNQ